MRNEKLIILGLLVLFILTAPIVRLKIDSYLGTQLSGTDFGKGVHYVLLMLSGAIILVLVWVGRGLIK